MSENTRKVFDIDEQKAKDILTVIKTIVPVISLIREWGKIEGQLSAAEKEEKRLKEEIDTFDAAIKLVKGDIVSALAEEHDKRCEVLRGIREKREKLENACEDFEGEVISYQEYAELYNWGDIYSILNSHVFENNEEILAFMFLIYNGKYPQKIHQSMVGSSLLKENFNHQGCDVLKHGWNTMLNALKANEI